MGTPKAQAAALRMEAVNSEVKVKAITAFIGEENCRELIKGHDLVLDALDNMSARKVLENACEAENIPMVDGAIAGWFGQVSTVMPGDGTMKKIYPTNENKGMEVELGNPSFTPAVIASIQVAEAVKVLLGRSGILQNKLLAIDLLNHEYEVLEL